MTRTDPFRQGAGDCLRHRCHSASPSLATRLGPSGECQLSRLARCSCGETRSSSEREKLFGFTDTSLNSDWSRRCCRHCGKYEVAHHPGCSAVRPDQYERHPFEPRNEAAEFDTFYCGCRGWD